jgi:sortase A
VRHFFRVLGMVGRTMVTAGVVLLLFAAYQLWGTGLHTRAAQSDLRDQVVTDFSVRLGVAPDTERSDAPEIPDDPVSPGDGRGIGEIFGLSDEEIEDIPPPEPGEAAGFISMPTIGSDWWYVEGTDLDHLRKGPGRFAGTSWPGQAGNAAIAGHRTTYGQPFHRIDELEPGDEIFTVTTQGEFRYEVVARGDLIDDMPIADPSDLDSGHFIVDPHANWILDDYDDDRLTLMACHPKYSAAQRIVVVAELVGPTAPTTPRPLDEDGDPVIEVSPVLDDRLLTNDPTARTPALLWAGAAGAIWLLAWQVGRTWRWSRWPALLGALPFAGFALFTCFTYAERLLPAGY